MYSCTLRYSEDISSWPEHVRENVAEVFHEEVVKDIGHFNECRLQNRSVFDCASDKHFSNENKPGCGSVGYRLIVSLYYLHIHKWLQFFPKEQFLFLRLKDMDSDPKTFMTDITDFFDMKQLPSGSASHLLAGHRNTQPVRTKMLPKTRKLLSDFFLPFNQQLVELTGDARFLW
jgi:N-acetylgalactosamine 4-sulfate 6-O-sulfotransferase